MLKAKIGCAFYRNSTFTVSNSYVPLTYDAIRQSMDFFINGRNCYI